MSGRCYEPYTGGYHSYTCIRDTEDGTHIYDGCQACGEIWDTDESNCLIGDDIMDDTACNHHWVRVVFDGQRLNDRCRTCGATRRPRLMEEMATAREAFDELRRYEDELGIKY